MLSVPPAESACAFVVDRVKRASGARWAQGAWRPSLGGGSDAPVVRLVATQRLRKVERPAARALVAWSGGARHADLLFRVPAPREVLALQARGRRCVSLLDEGADTGRHEDALAFCLHDLRHLEKYFDPGHHLGQKGFFAALDRAFEAPRWAALEARVDDDAWRADRDYVAADMNGSPVFLFAALKMKLKMAVRRALAREEHRPEPRGGPLEPHEALAFAAALDEMCRAMGMDEAARAAASRVSTKHDAADAATSLVKWFEARAG